MDRSISRRSALGLSCISRLIFAGLALVAASTTAFASEPCGTGTYPFPYTDVAGVTDPFCPGIMEAYVTGISKGTSPTTFSPNDDVIRLQMTTFLQRTVDQVLTRGSRRAALGQWWNFQGLNWLQEVGIGGLPQFCAADGESIWTTTSTSNQVRQVQASTGAYLGTWTTATSSVGVLAAGGRVFVVGGVLPGALYVIDPTQPPGSAPFVASLGNNPLSIAFDGTHLWTANVGPPGSVSMISPGFVATTVSKGFTAPVGVVYDGSHIWVTDGVGTLLKLDSSGGVLQTVSVGTAPQYPVFDGANIWVPNSGDSSITVVQASTGNVVATIPTNDNLSSPTAASFDGERILVTNSGNDSFTLYKAADLSFIANVKTDISSQPNGACSDGINFWVTLSGTGNLLRF